MKEQSTIRAMVAEANHKVSNCKINISLEPYNHKELEDTLTLLVSENTLTLIAVEPFLGHQLTIQGISIFHVTLTQFHQPWIQPLRMGKAPIATLCRQDQLVTIELESRDALILISVSVLTSYC